VRGSDRRGAATGTFSVSPHDLTRRDEPFRLASDYVSLPRCSHRKAWVPEYLGACVLEYLNA
jgi:hypothetical protein